MSVRIPGFSLLPDFLAAGQAMSTLTASLKIGREDGRSLSHSSPLWRSFALRSLLFNKNGQSLYKTCLIFRTWIHIALFLEWDKLWSFQGTSFSLNLSGLLRSQLEPPTAITSQKALLPWVPRVCGVGCGKESGQSGGLDTLLASVLL